MPARAKFKLLPASASVLPAGTACVGQRRIIVVVQRTVHSLVRMPKRARLEDRKPELKFELQRADAGIPDLSRAIGEKSAPPNPALAQLRPRTFRTFLYASATRMK